MGWIINAAITWFWCDFVEQRCTGRPWWVWAFWMLLPVLVAGALCGAIWLLLR